MPRIVNKMSLFVLRIIVNGLSLNVELENACLTVQAIYLELGVYLRLFWGIENGTSFPYRVHSTNARQYQKYKCIQLIGKQASTFMVFRQLAMEMFFNKQLSRAQIV